MVSNHGNLYKTLLALAFRALRSTYAEVNSTEEEKGRTEMGTETGTARAGWRTRNDEGNGERGGGRKQGGQQGQKRKQEPIGR